MKKVLIATLLVVGTATFAQDKTTEKPKRADMEKMTPEQRQQKMEKHSEKRLAKMTADYKLDAAQQEKMKQLFAEQAQQRQAHKAEMDKTKDKSMGKMKEARKNNEDKMKAILTPEQFTKWKSDQDAVMQKRREMMKERMNNRPAPGNDDMNN